jgi:site-specific DNA recombinase
LSIVDPRRVYDEREARSKGEGADQGLIWNQELLSGKVASVAALAKREKLCRRYVARIVRLAFLAPDIMQAIAHGKVPPALSLDHLKKGFPLDWQVQRASLGFSG